MSIHHLKLIAIYPIISLLDYIYLSGDKTLYPFFKSDTIQTPTLENIILLRNDANEYNHKHLDVTNLLILPRGFKLKSDIISSNNKIYRKGRILNKNLILDKGSRLEKGWIIPKNSTTILTDKEFKNTISKYSHIKKYNITTISKFFNKMFPIYSNLGINKHDLLLDGVSLENIANKLMG